MIAKFLVLLMNLSNKSHIGAQNQLGSGTQNRNCMANQCYFKPMTQLKPILSLS